MNLLALLIGLNLIGGSLIVQKVALAYLLARGNDRGLLLVSGCLWLLGSVLIALGVQDAI